MPRAFLKAREPFSSYSHFIGAVLSGAGLFVLLVRLLFDSSVTGSADRAVLRKQRVPFLRPRRSRPAAAEKARPQHDLCADRGQLYADYSQIHACAAQLCLSRRDLADCADRHCHQAAVD